MQAAVGGPRPPPPPAPPPPPPLATSLRTASFQRKLTTERLDIPDWLAEIQSPDDIDAYARAPETAFGCCPKRGWLRGLAFSIVLSRWYQLLVFLVVLANAAIYLLYKPLEPGSYFNELATQSSLPFAVIFSADVLANAVAFGIAGNGSFFASPWRLLDLVSTVFTWTSMLPSFGNLSTLRLLRVMRILTMIPATAGIMKALLSAGPSLVTVGLSVFVVVTCFALLGLQLWCGALAGTCGFSSTVLATLPATSISIPLGNGTAAANSTAATFSVASSIFPGLMPSPPPPPPTAFGNGTNTGIVAPSTAIYSGLPCGLPCTAENDFPGGVCVFSGGGDSCPSNYPVAFSYLNNRPATATASSQQPTTSIAVSYGSALVPLQCMRGDNPSYNQQSFDNFGSALLTSFWLYTTEGWSALANRTIHSFGLRWLVLALFVVHVYFGAFLLLEIVLAVVYENFRASVMGEGREQRRQKRIVRLALKQTAMADAAAASRSSSACGGRYRACWRTCVYRPNVVLSGLLRGLWCILTCGSCGCGCCKPPQPASTLPRPPASSLAALATSTNPLHAGRPPHASLGGGVAAERGSPASSGSYSRWWCSNGFPCFRRWVVVTPVFELISTAALLATAFILTVEGEDWWTLDIRRTSHMILDGIGAWMVLEALLRLLAWGPRAYFRDPIERVDVVLVGLIAADSIVNALPLMQGLPDETTVQPRALLMLRAFRCARLLLLWQGGRRTVHNLIKASGTASAVGLIFAVFLVAFSAIGMQLMGGKAAAAVASGKIPSYPQTNFDTLQNALIATFQATDNENSDDLLFRAMAYAGKGTVAFFVAALVIGNFIIFSTLIAVMLSHFEDSETVLADNHHNNNHKSDDGDGDELPRFPDGVPKVVRSAVVPGFLSRGLQGGAGCAGKLWRGFFSRLDRGYLHRDAAEEDEADVDELSKADPKALMAAAFAAESSSSPSSVTNPMLKVAVVPCPHQATLSFKKSAKSDPSPVARSARKSLALAAAALHGFKTHPERFKRASLAERLAMPKRPKPIVRVVPGANGRVAAITTSLWFDPSRRHVLPRASLAVITRRHHSNLAALRESADADPFAKRKSSSSAAESRILMRACDELAASGPQLLLRISISYEGLVDVRCYQQLPEPVTVLRTFGTTSVKQGAASGGSTRVLPTGTGTGLDVASPEPGPAGSSSASSSGISISISAISSPPAAVQVPKYRSVRALTYGAAPVRIATDNGDVSSEEQRADLLDDIDTTAEGMLKCCLRWCGGCLLVTEAVPLPESPPDSQSLFSPPSPPPGFVGAFKSPSAGLDARATTNPLAAAPSPRPGGTPASDHIVSSNRSLTSDKDSARPQSPSEAAGVVTRLALSPCTGRTLGCLCDCFCVGVRKSAAVFVTSRLFSWVSLVVVVWSVLNLLLSDGESFPGIPAIYLSAANLFTTTWFLVELALEIIARGFVRGPLACSRSASRWLDAAVAFSSLADLLASAGVVSVGFRTLRLIRAARALRGLRLVSAFASTRLLARSLFAAVPSLLGASAVLLVIMWICAVAGMSLFRGSMWTCNDPSVSSLGECTGAFTISGAQCGWLPTNALTLACKLSPTGWSFPRLVVHAGDGQNFDTIGEALLTMFEVLSGENWPGIMGAFSSAAGYLQMPRTDASKSKAAAFFVVTIFFLNAVLAEIFSGVFASTFLALRAKSTGFVLLTPSQRGWLENIKMMLRMTPSHPRQAPPHPDEAELSACSSLVRPWLKLRGLAFRVCMTPSFDTLVTAVVFANAATLAVKHAGQTADWASLQERLNTAYTGFFLLEMVVCLLGLGVKQYIRAPSNVYAAFLAVGSAALTFSPLPQVYVWSSLLRVLRLGRLMRLNKGSMQLKAVRSLVGAMPQFASVLFFIGVVIVIGACAFPEVFGGVRYSGTSFLGRDYNADSIGSALKLLLYTSTGENFNGIMRNIASVFPPYCLPAASFGVYRAGNNDLQNAYANWGATGLNATSAYELAEQAARRLRLQGLPPSVTDAVMAAASRSLQLAESEGIVPQGEVCGSRLWVSALLWVAFFSLVALLILNLLTALFVALLESHLEEAAESHGFVSLTQGLGQQYQKLWIERDPSRSLLITVEQATSLIQHLPLPLGVAPPLATNIGSNLLTRCCSRRKPATEISSEADPDSTPGSLAVAAAGVVRSLAVAVDFEGRVQYHALLHALLERLARNPPLGRPCAAATHSSAESLLGSMLQGHAMKVMATAIEAEATSGISEKAKLPSKSSKKDEKGVELTATTTTANPRAPAPPPPPDPVTLVFRGHLTPAEARLAAEKVAAARPIPVPQASPGASVAPAPSSSPSAVPAESSGHEDKGKEKKKAPWTISISFASPLRAVTDPAAEKLKEERRRSRDALLGLLRRMRRATGAYLNAGKLKLNDGTMKPAASAFGLSIAPPVKPSLDVDGAADDSAPGLLARLVVSPRSSSRSMPSPPAASIPTSDAFKGIGNPAKVSPLDKVPLLASPRSASKGEEAEADDAAPSKHGALSDPSQRRGKTPPPPPPRPASFQVRADSVDTVLVAPNSLSTKEVTTPADDGAARDGKRESAPRSPSLKSAPAPLSSPSRPLSTSSSGAAAALLGSTTVAKLATYAASSGGNNISAVELASATGESGMGLGVVGAVAALSSSGSLLAPSMLTSREDAGAGAAVTRLLLKRKALAAATQAVEESVLTPGFSSSKRAASSKAAEKAASLGTDSAKGSSIDIEEMLKREAQEQHQKRVLTEDEAVMRLYAVAEAVRTDCDPPSDNSWAFPSAAAARAMTNATQVAIATAAAAASLPPSLSSLLVPLPRSLLDPQTSDHYRLGLRGGLLDGPITPQHVWAATRIAAFAKAVAERRRAIEAAIAARERL